MFQLKGNLTGQPTGLNSFLTPEECGTVIDSGENDLGLKVAQTEDQGVTNIRRSEICWLSPSSGHGWLLDRIKDCINGVNANWFGFNLIGLDDIQFTKYSYKKDERPDYYSSHKDTMLLPGGTVRKLSFTIQLSAPETYGGCDVVLYETLTDTITLSRERGSISFFPSYTIHEVTPVTRGVRYSLVGWVYGPAFV